jgi:hypothetical protein
MSAVADFKQYETIRSFYVNHCFGTTIGNNFVFVHQLGMLATLVGQFCKEN